MIEGSAWGEPFRVVGAPLIGTMSIAGHDIDDALAYVREDKPNFMAETQEGAEGLVGNAGVWNRIVVLHLGARPRFGILSD